MIRRKILNNSLTIFLIFMNIYKYSMPLQGIQTPCIVSSQLEQHRYDHRFHVR